MSVVADYPDWSPHVAHAQQIAATGVPLLTNHNRLYSTSSAAIPASSTITSGALTPTQVGYEVYITAQFPSGTATPFVKVSLFWVDTTIGFTVTTDTFIVPGCLSPNQFTVSGRGPTKANQLTVNVTNLDSANAATVTLAVAQNSRVYPADDWSWINHIDQAVTVPGFTLPALPDDESVLGVLDGITIPAGSQNTYLFGMHDGPVDVGYEVNTGAASNLSIRIRPKPDTSYSAHNIIYSATQPPSNFQVAAPRAPLGVVVANSATTAMVLSLALIRAG